MLLPLIIADNVTKTIKLKGRKMRKTTYLEEDYQGWKQKHQRLGLNQKEIPNPISCSSNKTVPAQYL